MLGKFYWAVNFLVRSWKTLAATGLGASKLEMHEIESVTPNVAEMPNDATPGPEIAQWENEKFIRIICRMRHPAKKYHGKQIELAKFFTLR